MRKILFLLLMIFKTGAVLAQADTLARDENDRFVYYQVVSQPGMLADSLFNRATLFLQKVYTKDRLRLSSAQKEKGMLAATGGVLVSKKSMLAKHQDASISFKFYIEVKDDKYRYWFTDFVITPYARDRYANYVPVSGKNTVLEKGPDKLSADDFKGYIDQLLAGCREMGAVLKSYMEIKHPKAEEKPAKVILKEW